MLIIASFNYMQSDTAATIGLLAAAGIAAALIWYGRPLVGAILGALSWATIGYLVGMAGRGDMTGLIAAMYAIFGFPAGAIIAGVGAWIRKAVRKSTTSA